MDKRLAVLEAEVAHIKSSMAGIKEDTRKISSDSTDAKETPLYFYRRARILMLHYLRNHRLTTLKLNFPLWKPR